MASYIITLLASMSPVFETSISYVISPLFCTTVLTDLPSKSFPCIYAFFLLCSCGLFTSTDVVSTFNASGTHLTACDSHGFSSVTVSVTVSNVVVASVSSPAFAAPPFPALPLFPAAPPFPALPLFPAAPPFPAFALFPFAALLAAFPLFAAPSFPALPLLSPVPCASLPLLSPLLLSPVLAFAYGFVSGVP